MNARFLAGEEEKAELSFAEYGGCHVYDLYHRAAGSKIALT